MLRKTIQTVCLLAGMAVMPAIAEELRLGSFAPPASIEQQHILMPWAEAVKKATNDEVTVKIYPGGALGKGPVAQFKRVLTGVADVTWGLPGFTPSTFPLTGVIEYPFVTNSGADAVDGLYNAMPILGGEWKDVKLITLWASEPLFIMTKEKPVRQISDLKGMKIRTPSKWLADVVSRLGGSPVAMPITDVYIALDSGVIDGVVTGPIGASSFKLVEVAKYYTIGIPFGRLPFFLAMNKGKWDSLSDAQKAAIDQVSGKALGHRATVVMETFGAKVIEGLRANSKMEVIEFDSANMAAAKEVMAVARDEMIAALDAKGLPGSAVLKAMQGQ